MKRTLAVVLILAACDSPIAPEDRRVPIETLLTEPIAVALNPSGIAPLTAEIIVRTEAETTVQVRVLGPEPVDYEALIADEHVVPVLGFYPGMENQVEVRVTDHAVGFGLDTITISTDPLPDFFPEIEVTTAEPSRMEPGWNLSSLSIGVGEEFLSYPVVFDRAGAVRWYLDLSSFGAIVFMVERLRNGNLLFGQGTAIYEYDMLGREVARWEIPGYWFHHDVVEKPDGNLLIAVDKQGLETVEDHVIELDRSSGEIVREWDLREVLDTARRDFLGDDVDWFHMNSVWYDESDGGLIISGRHQGVAKVSAANELVWILAPHRGWSDRTSPFLLTAADGEGAPYPEAVQLGDERALDFDWPWAQHAAMILPNGNLFLFDNGDHRQFVGTDPPYSRGVEYAINEEFMTVRQVWAYGRDRGADFYSAIISDVDHLPSTGNRLIMPGIVFNPSRALVTEVAPDGSVVFEAELHFRNALSDGAIRWGGFDLVYRSERLPLYP